MTKTAPCPAHATLQALLHGTLPPAEEVRLTGHLDTCVDCRDRLETLATGDGTSLRVEANRDRLRTTREEALQRAMRELKNQTCQDEAAPSRRPDDELFLAALAPAGEPGYLGRLGPYLVTEIIGRGGTGVVFKGFDPGLHRFVALKVLAPQLAGSGAARQRFAREGRAAAAVNHEHIVSIFGVDEAHGLPYLVMEYVWGVSLQERLDRDGPLELADILRVGVQAATGLAAAHAQGLVHRDIKPANILLAPASGGGLGLAPNGTGGGPSGTERPPAEPGANPITKTPSEAGASWVAKITDFGLARAADDASLTQSGVVTGTPQYMAPEQARGEAVDHRADLFSLGSVLYALCTGRPPFRASSTLAVLRRICEDTPRPIQEINPTVPDWLAAVVSILHAKNREDRFASAAVVAQVLSQYLAHLEQPSLIPPPPAPTVARSTPGWGGTALKRVVVLLVLVALFLLARGTGLLQLAARALHGSPAGNDRQTPLRPENGLATAELRLGGQPGDPHGTVLGMSFAPGGPLLALACEDETVTLWDLSANRARTALRGRHGQMWSVAFSPDGKTLASGGAARPSGVGEEVVLGELKLWDAVSGRELRSFPGHSALVCSVAFSPDGKTLASAGWDRTVRLWDVATGKRRQLLRGHDGPVRCVAFSPDGKTLATGSFDGTARIWDVATGRQQAMLRTTQCQVHAVAFSPDGKTLATAENPGGWPARGEPDLADGGGPGWVKLWDLGLRREKAILNGHKGRVLGLAFAPDGKTLVSCGGECNHFGEIKLWNAVTGRELLVLEGPKGWVECVAFAPDGRKLVTAGGTCCALGGVKLWEFTHSDS
jgi:WD40 repeat protein/serine/threonine protein kinase